MHSIKTISTITGLSTETLRAWERRYDGILPARSANGRRQYSEDDLAKLSLLAELTRNGHAISKIAALDYDALLALKTRSQAPSSLSLLLPQIIDALRDYRIERCEALLKQALIACDTIDYIKEVLMPSLTMVGELWHREQINIAQEHMFSCCVKRIVLSMVNNLHPHSPQMPAMLFATPSDEPHEFGILMSCLLAASLGFRCYYLGPNLPAHDLLEAIRHLQPAITVIGAVKTPPELTTAREIGQIAAVGDETAIWLGGLGARHLLPLPAKIDLIEDMDDFYRKAKQWLSLHR